MKGGSSDTECTLHFQISPAAPTDSMKLPSHIETLKTRFSHLYDCLDLHRVLAWHQDTSSLIAEADDFSSDHDGGRGTHYITAQASIPMARSRGIETLLMLITHKLGITNATVLDLLGGDGLIRKVASRLHLSGLEILTCDISKHMVQAACDAGLPALHQRAERLLCKDSSMDAVLLAYGSHHIDPSQRLDTFREAYRVLRTGGVFVLHDFEVGGAMDEWFGNVVDAQSVTGHAFEHFSKAEMEGYFAHAGFADYSVFEMADPYCADGKTLEEAELTMGEYLVDMYGLVKVEEARGRRGAAEWALQKARDIFGSSRLKEVSGGWRIELPRSALIGVAVRRR